MPLPCLAVCFSSPLRTGLAFFYCRTGRDGAIFSVWRLSNAFALPCSVALFAAQDRPSFPAVLVEKMVLYLACGYSWRNLGVVT